MQELDLIDVIKIFWKRKLLLIFTTVIFAVLGLLYSMFIIVPEYTAETTLALKVDQTSNYETNKQRINTYVEMALSESNLGKIKNDLNLRLSTDELKKEIKTVQMNDTLLIKIKVTDFNAEMAKNIADETSNTLKMTVYDVYNDDNLLILDSAKIPEKPSNINHVKYIVLFASLGFAIACVAICILESYNNKKKNK